RLDVAMNDSERVNPGERLADLDEHTTRVLETERRAGLESHLEIGTEQQFHDDVREAGGRSRVVEDVDDMGALDAGSELCFLAESSYAFRVIGELARHELHGHPHAETRVLGDPDMGHPAGAEQGDQSNVLRNANTRCEVMDTRKAPAEPVEDVRVPRRGLPRVV